MSDIVFMDTETLGLELDSPIWEFAAIRRNEKTGEDDAQMHLFINHNPDRMSVDLPEQFVADYEKRWAQAQEQSRVTQPANAAALISAFFAGRPHVVGAVPNFDTERIARQLLRPRGYGEPWHYHLIDVENLIVGYLHGVAARAIDEAKLRGEEPLPFLQARSMALPWKSDDLSRSVGVHPNDFERHTAMGDVLWVKAQYDAVTGGAA